MAVVSVVERFNCIPLIENVPRVNYCSAEDIMGSCCLAITEIMKDLTKKYVEKYLNRTATLRRLRHLLLSDDLFIYFLFANDLTEQVHKSTFFTELPATD